MDISLNSRAAPSVTLIVPCYNEAAGLVQTADVLLDVIAELRSTGRANQDSCLCLVDDGSTDGTWQIITRLSRSAKNCCGIRLTRNFGHQNALLAGLLSAPGDVLISLDADLQDDPAAIKDMVDSYRNGSDIVCGVRDDRSSDNWPKRLTARAYYKLLSLLAVPIVEDHADFRLMSRRAIEGLRDFPEVNLFLRAMIPQLGFQQTLVHYKRQPRLAGKTKYSFGKMMSLGLNGITSFTAVPLRFIALMGLFISFGSLAIAGWALWMRLFTDAAIPGWASSVVPMYLLGGIQILSIGVVGEYVAKLYLEAKARPRFLLRDSLGVQHVSESHGDNTANQAAADQRLQHGQERQIG